MSTGPTEVMIAAYLDTRPANLDYDAVKQAGAKLEGVVCVSRDNAGKLRFEESDHLARKGSEIVGGAGLVVGLFAPPLLVATAVGALIGGGLGDLAHHDLKEKIEQDTLDTIPFGGAGLIVAYPRASAERVDQAVTHSLKKAVSEVEGKKVDDLKRALIDARGQMAAPVE